MKYRKTVKKGKSIKKGKSVKYLKNKKNRTIKIRRFNKNPIHGGTSVVGKANEYLYDNTKKYLYDKPKEYLYDKPKEFVKDRAAEFEETKDNSISDKLKNRRLSTTILSPAIGLYKNTGEALNKLRGEPSLSPSSGQNPPVDISKGLRYAYDSAKQSISSAVTPAFTPAEKENVRQALGYLVTNHHISQSAYNNALAQLDKKDGILQMQDSIVSLMAPIQSIVKVVGDWFIGNTDLEDMKGRQTVVKLLQFPKSSKSFVKGSLGTAGKDIAELDEYMLLVKDAFPNMGDKVESDLTGVDNLLANVLNGCVGAGCKEGEVTHKPVLENIITVNNNIKLKKVLQGLKEKEALNREGM